MKEDMNCGRIFNSMTDEGWHAVTDRNRKEISDYVNKHMFDCDDNPDAELIGFFRSADFGAPTASKGSFVAPEEYSTDTDSVLEEVRIWAELAADRYIAELPEDDRRFFSREYVGRIISRYVLERVAEVAEMSKSRMTPIPQALFRR